MKSFISKVIDRINAKHRGWVFTPRDFYDLGSRDAVAQALYRLDKMGKIRHLAWGLYDYPVIHPKLGMLSPDPDKIALALAAKTNSKIQLPGSRAANILGISEQVPAQAIYRTDGPTRIVEIKKQKITLIHSSARAMLGAGKVAGIVLQALRYLGKENIDDNDIKKLGNTITKRDKSDLHKLIPKMQAWMRPILLRIVAHG